MEKKAAFVALAGRPSAGKSTLLNSICGEKVAIVSAVPQTTRNNIRGIYNGERGQLIFVDTPGRHKSGKKFNKKLLELSDRAASESDLILYVLDASRPPAEEELAIVEFLAPYTARTVAVINKVDHEDADLSTSHAFLSDHIPALARDRCFEVSAKNNEGIQPVIDALFTLSPLGKPFYDNEFYTDQEVDFRIAEIIREQAINRLRQEIPHSLYVDIADLQFTEAGIGTGGNGGVFTADPLSVGEASEKTPNEIVPRLWVRAFIVVERESQKGVVVGSGGSMIKAIRLASLAALKKIFDWRITLDLRVKTAKNWRQNDNNVRRITGKN